RRPDAGPAERRDLHRAAPPSRAVVVLVRRPARRHRGVMMSAPRAPLRFFRSAARQELRVSASLGRVWGYWIGETRGLNVTGEPLERDALANPSNRGHALVPRMQHLLGYLVPAPLLLLGFDDLATDLHGRI